MPNYQLGKIYKLINDVNDIIYVGSTCQKWLCQRMGLHRSDGKKRSTPIYTAMAQIGVPHFRIVLIKNYPCASKAELEAEEYAVMQKLQKTGVTLYNATTDGSKSDASRQKMSQTQTGTNNTNFKRGSIRKTQWSWSFSWYEHGKQYTKGFSISKYTESGAHGLALMAQDHMYPITRLY